MAWFWLWSVFLSLVSRLRFHLRLSFLLLFEGLGSDVTGQSLGSPLMEQGLGVASACEEVALAVGPWAQDVFLDGAAPAPPVFALITAADGEAREEERQEEEGRGNREEFC